MFYNQVVGLRAVGRSEKQEGADSNMSAIVCPMGETGLTNLPKSGGGMVPRLRKSWDCFLLLSFVARSSADILNKVVLRKTPLNQDNVKGKNATFLIL